MAKQSGRRRKGEGTAGALDADGSAEAGEGGELVATEPESPDAEDLEGAEPEAPEAEGAAGSETAGEGDESAAGGDDTEGSQGERASRVGPGDTLTDEELERSVAALLFASPEPISVGRLQQLLEHPRKARVEEALEGLGRRFEAAGLPFVVRPLAGGWRLLTAPEVGDVVTRLGKARKAEKLSPAALETLAIIAYRQPVTKAEIEAIRGVQAGAVLRALVDRGLVKVAGRSDQPGGALEYGTTTEFLDRFGLGSIQDLPRDGELLEG